MKNKEESLKVLRSLSKAPEASTSPPTSTFTIQCHSKATNSHHLAPSYQYRVYHIIAPNIAVILVFG